MVSLRRRTSVSPPRSISLVLFAEFVQLTLMLRSLDLLRRDVGGWGRRRIGWWSGGGGCYAAGDVRTNERLTTQKCISCTSPRTYATYSDVARPRPAVARLPV